MKTEYMSLQRLKEILFERVQDSRPFTKNMYYFAA